jgi:hypothetical protein
VLATIIAGGGRRPRVGDLRTTTTHVGHWLRWGKAILQSSTIFTTQEKAKVYKSLPCIRLVVVLRSNDVRRLRDVHLKT